MSEKKVFKQMQLPFQSITSPTPSATNLQSVEKSSPKARTPKTPKSSHSSRKRKPSSEGQNARLLKIGRLTTKENIAEPEVPIELSDNDDDAAGETSKNLKPDVETTLTTTSTEKVIHIKLPSRSKGKQPVVVQKSLEEDPDDSVVYLEELSVKSTKKVKKSAKKSEEKRKKATESVKKTLNEDDIHKENESDNELVEIIDEKDPEEAEIIDDPTKMDIDDEEPVIPDQISKLMDASGTTSISPVKDMQEILSDDEHQTTLEHDTSFNKSIDQASNAASRVLTPKAQARRDEFERRRIEKELQRKKERDEREFQRLKEKEQREEAKRKEKEEKDEQRKREKDEREKKRLAEIEKKEEEKRQKEDERKRLVEQKEEEKRQKEEERRQKEDERKRQNEARDEEKRKKDAEKLKDEERKKKTAQAFTKFFVPVKKKATTPMMQDDEASKESAESTEPSTGNFMAFQVRERMRIAPCVRYNLSMNEIEKLDAVMSGSDKDNETYLKQLENGKRSPKSSGKTWPLEEKAGDEDDDEVMIVDELQGFGEDIKEDDDAHLKMKHRGKFLMFCENRRPAFYGTWRKKSGKVYARRPFAQDEKFFDYENESDDEWEEEEPGESLHGSDSEKEKEANEEDYEVDNDFFVPHGHLSDDELNPDGEEGEIEDNSPETQKAKLKILQQEFAAEMKKKTEKIKPRLIGCFWMNGDEDEDGATMKNDKDKKYHCSTIVWRILKAREMWCSDEEIKMEDFEPEVPEIEEEKPSEKPAQQKTPAQQKIRPKIDNEMSTKELIRLVHGNTNSKKYIIREFQAYRLKNFHMNADFQEFSVKSVDEKMLEVADYKSCPDDGPLFGKKCWYVKSEVVKQYFGDEKLPLPNQWNYILEKEVKEKKPKQNDDNKKESREVSPMESTTVEQPAAQNLVIESKPSQAPRPAVNNSGKKRVQLLMSLPRGTRVDEDKKNSLISQFLNKNNQTSAVAQQSRQPNVDDEVIEIID